MTETGIWSKKEADLYHQSSPKLAEWIKNYLDPEFPVYDFGCGNGYYLGELEKSGFLCYGFEGTAMKYLCNHVKLCDLTKPQTVTHRGSVLSLEVGEHLPIWAEQTFLDTITNACNGDLIISWALPGQPGVGHINCQPKEYIVSEVERRGFKFLHDFTEDARNNVDENTSWFTRTLLVFSRI